MGLTDMVLEGSADVSSQKLQIFSEELTCLRSQFKKMS